MDDEAAKKAFLDAMDEVASEEDLPLEALRQIHPEFDRSRLRIGRLKRHIPKGGVGAEIGVLWGHLSEGFLRHCKPTKLYLVDPWDKLHPDKMPNQGMYSYFGRIPARLLRARVEEIAAENKDVVEVVHDYADAFFETIQDDSLDWIYIDGNHKYEFVLSDLKNAKRKVKKTGVIMGDDYWFKEKNSNHGVNRALEEFLSENDYKLVVEAPSQFVLLPS